MIRRAPRPDGNFTVLHNAMLRDQRLSYKARGLLCYILSMPDNYRFTVERLTRTSPDGRQSVITGMRELRKAGYLTVRRLQSSDGRWRTEQTIHDEPQPVDDAVDNAGDEMWTNDATESGFSGVR